MCVVDTIGMPRVPAGIVTASHSHTTAKSKHLGGGGCRMHVEEGWMCLGSGNCTMRITYHTHFTNIAVGHKHQLKKQHPAAQHEHALSQCNDIPYYPYSYPEQNSCHSRPARLLAGFKVSPQRWAGETLNFVHQHNLTLCAQQPR